MLNYIKNLFSKKTSYKVEKKELVAIAEMLENAFQQVIDDYNTPIVIKVKSAQFKDTFGFLIEVKDKELKEENLH